MFSRTRQSRQGGNQNQNDNPQPPSDEILNDFYHRAMHFIATINDLDRSHSRLPPFRTPSREWVDIQIGLLFSQNLNDYHRELDRYLQGAPEIPRTIPHLRLAIAAEALGQAEERLGNTLTASSLANLPEDPDSPILAPELQAQPVGAAIHPWQPVNSDELWELFRELSQREMALLYSMILLRFGEIFPGFSAVAFPAPQPIPSLTRDSGGNERLSAMVEESNVRANRNGVLSGIRSLLRLRGGAGRRRNRETEEPAIEPEDPEMAADDQQQEDNSTSIYQRAMSGLRNLRDRAGRGEDRSRERLRRSESLITIAPSFSTQSSVTSADLVLTRREEVIEPPRQPRGRTRRRLGDLRASVTMTAPRRSSPQQEMIGNRQIERENAPRTSEPERPATLQSAVSPPDWTLPSRPTNAGIFTFGQASNSSQNQNPPSLPRNRSPLPQNRKRDLNSRPRPANDSSRRPQSGRPQLPRERSSIPRNPIPPSRPPRPPPLIPVYVSTRPANDPSRALHPGTLQFPRRESQGERLATFEELAERGLRHVLDGAGVIRLVEAIMRDEDIPYARALERAALLVMGRNGIRRRDVWGFVDRELFPE